MRMVVEDLGLHNGLTIALIDPFGRPIGGEHKQGNIAVIGLCYGRVIIETSRA